MKRLGRRIETPVGEMAAMVDHSGSLIRLEFLDHLVGAIEWRDGIAQETVEQLTEYFAGDRRVFDLTTAVTGSKFQERVWDTLCQIPYGTTITYGELARRVGAPGGYQAVGRANATNPLAIVIPCHRVIGADGSLTGYAGGLERKRWLLAHEGSLTADLFAPTRAV